MPLSRESIRIAYEDACRGEIEALKPGNVHVFADGHGMTVEQFLVSARVSSGPLTDPGLPVGRRILEAVRATREAVGANTNLGIILLSAPLIRAAEDPGDLRENLGQVLDGMGMDDARAVFEAIALASPGGLGSAERHDVREEPKAPLLEAMREATGRDMIARQYSTNFEDVFATGHPALQTALSRAESGMWPTIAAYMAFLAAFPDSHVSRKFGRRVAARVQGEAGRVRARLESAHDEQARIDILTRFDRDLKARAINPGTSADLTMACLLVYTLSAQLARPRR